MMPGLVDCHIHAPQLPIQALGTDRQLLEWLNTYTFPIEAKFSDAKFAQDVHQKIVVSFKELILIFSKLKRDQKSDQGTG